MEAIFLYDGTFEGFLTTVFQVFEEKQYKAKIVKPKHYQPDMFVHTTDVVTDNSKAKRVWRSLNLKATKMGANQLRKAFLSEIKGIENVLLRYVIYAYSTESFVNIDYSNKDVLRVSQIAQMVGREKHRMEAFVRFKLTKDGYYFAEIEPDFNVIPLIERHFKDRYADQQWVIYDKKRKYGIHYDLDKVNTVVFENFDYQSSDTINLLDESEVPYQKLWKDYFDSTNIESRKNMKLHTQHIPKRYWKHLSEKQPN